MIMPSRKKRKRNLRILFALAALLCVAGMAVLIFWPRGDRPAASPSSPVLIATDTDNAAAQTLSPAVATAGSAAVRTPVPTLPLQKSPLARSLYQGALALEDGMAQGRVSLHYVNNGLDTLYAVYLHLHANTLAPDSMAIQDVTLNGVRAYYTLSADGGTLCVPLVNELRPGEGARIYVQFSLDSRALEAGQESMLAGLPFNPFPTAAVYENGWLLDVAPGQAGFAPLADWRLCIAAAEAPAIVNGTVAPLGTGLYLCTAQTTECSILLG